MQTQRVQEGRQALHHDQDADGEAGPGGEDDVEQDAAPELARHAQTAHQHHGPQHLGQLCGRDGQTSVRCQRTGHFEHIQ